ncbi:MULTISPECIES: hypothetical protein [unclassified Arthrobacter]|uniref:hypothetical protein n=1 Tax=unclassified Arthrobacter TaxID=235627 RepID=UPI001D139F8C|nr:MULTISPECIES: hypothetical protein [unclassified Arthrobacter]MCC3291415.1 hypothetical protein [Arthrobacter sp. zg-Y1110]MCC3301211.1 hypothetical protein [Arthrobacter sp. zg-Y895]MCC3302458.1 hypothetical protein [Arthrobacter sp. zg-Y895]UWX83833.1 hypothetical protein N2K99_09930 [Arthrobacter sp. zg-Y1110]
MRKVKELAAAAATVLLLSACTDAGSSSADEQAAPAGRTVEGTLSSFGSVNEVYDAVVGVLDCDPGTTAEPVTMQIDGYLPEYRMCTDTVEIVRYENEADRTKASELLNAAENPLPYFAEGSNWHVLVLPGREGQMPGPDQTAALAEELGGRFVSPATG